MSFRGFLYAVARLLGDVNAIRKGRVSRRIGRRIAGKLTGRWFRRIFGVGILLSLGLVPALAQEGQRVDLFTPDGKRQGYVVVDEKSGRADFYDAKSNRLGWGRITSSGRVERFNLDGSRQGEAVLPFKHWREER